MTSTEISTFEQLQREISARYPELSQKLQQAACYIRDNPESVALSTVADLARKASVSPAALIRLAAALGFTGFSEMQQLFRSHMLTGGNYRVRAQVAGSYGQNGNNSILDSFAHASSEAIQQLQSVPEELIEKAVDKLAQANNTFIMGLRRAFPVASYLAYSFWQSQKPVQLIDGIGGMAQAQVESMQAGDVLVAISYHPHAEETRSIINQALNQQVTVILLTDGKLSSPPLKADFIIEIPEAEIGGFRSLTSSMCLAQTLVVTLAYRLGDIDKTTNITK